ncbi:hypothetical protein B0T25DRAFT_615903 [Lasiosphaeria hispida]|uniref:DUF6536 domain-containing protein n=1 Tax=Lasiosphaeria hispida TaxID=260671 RepID=A0AAJ0M9R0_9PEZI|nr:hypothetical protein B0T25DRAFT_615903 [Lasiosphaeria hispida]
MRATGRLGRMFAFPRESVRYGLFAISTPFYEGACDQSTRVNLVLHLLLNIFSALAIASSNFFMQILNAPTRREVDRVHANSGGTKWLEMGVPSIRNAFHVARFKTLL